MKDPRKRKKEGTTVLTQADSHPLRIHHVHELSWQLKTDGLNFVNEQSVLWC